MAINLNNNQDDQNAQGMNQALTNQAQPQQDNNSQQPQQLSTSAPMSSTPAAPASAPTPTQQGKAPASSGNFTNLKTYLNANSGNRVGQAVNQRMQNTATGAQKSINQASTAFGQKLEQGSLKNMGTAVQEVGDISNAARQVTYQKPANVTPQATPQGTKPNRDFASSAVDSAKAKAELMAQNPLTPEQLAAQPQAANTSNTTPEVGGVLGTPAVPAAAQTPEPTKAPQFLSDDQQNRFAEIINARYQGPQNLRDSGLYDPAFERVSKAQDRLNQAQTAQGREGLLRDTFGNRAYNQGQNKLDSIILNADQGAVQNLLAKKDQIGNLQNNLTTAQNQAQNLSTQRAADISNIQEQARTSFNTQREAELAATDERLASVVNDWDKLPEYYKQIIRDNPTGTLNLSSEEAAMLGIGSGAGLYNLGEEVIRTNQAERDRLVSSNEVARQLALSQLAGLDQSKRLSTNTNFSDLDRAGTQTALDALDVAGTQQALKEAEANFRDSALGANLTGTGSKKVSRGNAFGKKTSTYNASVGGNVADMLAQAGYDVNAQAGAGIGNSLLQNKDLLDNYLNATNTNRSVDAEIGGSTLESGAKGAATGAAIGSVIPGAGTLVGGALGAVAGAALGSNSTDTLQMGTDVGNQLGQLGIPGVGAYSQGVQDVRNLAGNAIRGVGNALGGTLGSGIGSIASAVGGIDTGAMKAYGSAIAKDLALQDLQNKYANYLKGQGFENRTNVQDNEQTLSRTEGLRALLANMDKTNR